MSEQDTLTAERPLAEAPVGANPDTEIKPEAKRPSGNPGRAASDEKRAAPTLTPPAVPDPLKADGSDVPATPKPRRRGRKKDSRQGELAIDAPLGGADDRIAQTPDPEAEDSALGPAPDRHTVRCSIEVRGLLAGDPLPEIDADLVLVAEALADFIGDELPAAQTLPADPAALEARLLEAGDARVLVLVGGDPTIDGPGRALLAALGPRQVRLIAAPGPLQRSLARIGLSSAEVEHISLDAIGLDGFAARLRSGRLYAVELGTTPPWRIGQQLESGGFHQSRVWLIEPDPEREIQALLAFELSDSDPDLGPGSTLVVSAIGDGSTLEWPGIEAERFEQALPQAARLLALAWLQPACNEVGWCIEPGEAAVALDWSHTLPAASIHSIASDETALERARAESHAGEGLRQACGGTFRDLEQLPDPDAIFIRAGEEFTQQVRTGWDRLLPGGRMVVAAEDEQSRQELMHFANRHTPASWQDLSVACGDREQGRARLAPAQSVRMMAWRKPPRG